MLFLHRHALPLRWVRLPLLIFTLGMSGVCIAVCAQAISGTKNLEKSLAMMANADGVQNFRFDMQDVRATTDVLLAVACLISLVGFVIAATLIWDWLFLLIASPTARSSVPSLSTRTLKLQGGVLAFLSLWLFTVLIPSTDFVRRRHAMVFDGSIMAVLPSNLSTVDTQYWDYGFLRCLAAAPWFTLIASLPTTFVTICASYFTLTETEEDAVATKEKSLG